MAQEDEALVRRLYDVIERRDLARLPDLLADDIRWSSPVTVPGGGIRRGLPAVLEGAARLFAAWPDITVHLDVLRIDRDQVGVRGRYETRHGQFVGFSDSIVLREGRIARILSAYDGAALYRAVTRGDDDG